MKRLLHRTLDRIEVPPLSAMPLPSPDFRLALVTGVAAVVVLTIGSSVGDIHRGAGVHNRLIAAGSALGFVALGVYSVRRAANEVHRVLLPRVGGAHAGIVRMLITLGGLLVVLVLALGLLAVPVGQLVLGGALTGVVVGIAAQQSLGNVFAGLVLLLARPFAVGDHIRVRSGAMGGEMRGTVAAMGLTYVTLDTTEGSLALPNAALLAAAVGPAPDSDPIPPMARP